MSTTLVNFVKIGATVSGSASAVVLASSPYTASSLATNTGGVVIDKLSVDLSTAGYAKNGAFLLSLSASTPVTVDLTATATGTTSAAGDTSFATASVIVFHNYGAADVTVSPGASNPFSGPLGGTAPTFTVPAGASVAWSKPAGWTVDSTHKTLKFDPGASAASIGVSVGGA